MILRPSSSAMKSFLFLCLRTERVPVTSTDLIFLPTISLSRSRRSTSTSGNSGIVAPLIPRFLLESRPRDPGGGLFGLFLRTAFALAIQMVVDVHRCKEVFSVVGALVAHDVTGPTERTRGGAFLEPRLVIAATRTGRGVE